MEPRTGKGPSWANESRHLQSQTPTKNTGEVNPRDDNQMDVNSTPSQDALSDMEWMKQRMAKSIVEDSDMTTPHPGPSHPNVADVNQVCVRESLVLRCRLTQLKTARSLIERSNQRHYSQNRSPFRPKPRLHLHGRGLDGAIQNFWRDLTGVSSVLLRLRSPALHMLTGALPSSQVRFHSEPFSKMISTDRDIRVPLGRAETLGKYIARISFLIPPFVIRHA